jgi:hypothetical protein
MRYFVFSLLLFAAGIGVGHLDQDEGMFAPVARVRTQDGFFITAIQQRTATRRACRESLDRFVKPLEKNCPGCLVEWAGCATELEGMELALARGEQLPVYTVSSSGVRLALVGPPQAVQRTCEQIVAHARSMGTVNASCVSPREASPTF